MPESLSPGVPLTPEHHEILWHAIGMNTLTFRKPFGWWSDSNNHRNSYCVDRSDAPEVAMLADMVERGIMTPGKVINGGADAYFHATTGGIVYAREAFIREQNEVAHAD